MSNLLARPSPRRRARDLWAARQGPKSRDRVGDPVSAVKSASSEVHSLRDLSPQQWKSGIAAWLGWLFDGLDMHLYVLVAAPFVAQLIGVTDTRDPAVGWH